MTITYDAGEPRAVERAVKSAKQRDELRKEGLRQTLSTEPGRAWLHGLLESCGPLRTPFSSDPYSTAFNCGEANIGLRLIVELHACSTELYLVMMKENQDG